MIIVITNESEKGPIYSEILDPLKDKWFVFSPEEKTDAQILALKPNVVVIAHKNVVAHCKAFREAGGPDREFRMLAVLTEENANDAVMTRIEGADSCLVASVNDNVLRHAIKNEMAAARRTTEALSMIYAKTVIEKRYELKKLLGIGLRASVFLAYDRVLGRSVTLKMLRKMILNYPEVIGEYLSEANKLLQLESPFLAKLIEVGEWNGAPFLVYDVPEAKNLYTMLREKELNEDRIQRIALSIVRALIEMKHARILHFNIKPENILCIGGICFLIDFGLVSLVEAPLNNTCFPYWSDSAFSSPEFFSPAVTLTARSDIYSLGILLYTLAVRKNPFMGYHYLIAEKRHFIEDISVLPHDNRFTQNFVITVEAMTLLRPNARPRLRDLEVIFSQSIALAGAKISQMQEKMLNADRRFKEGEEEQESAGDKHEFLQKTDTASIARSRSIRNFPPPPAEPKVKDLSSLFKYLCKHPKIPLTVIPLISLLFYGGFYLGKREVKPIYFKQGSLMMFMCYNGHTHPGRTLDFRTYKCEKCKDRTSPSYTCRKCKRVYGLSLWPLRDMTDEECVEFEKKLSKCPFCKSTDIAQTPLPVPEKPAKDNKGRGKR